MDLETMIQMIEERQIFTWDSLKEIGLKYCKCFREGDNELYVWQKDNILYVFNPLGQTRYYRFYEALPKIEEEEIAN